MVDGLEKERGNHNASLINLCFFVGLYGKLAVDGVLKKMCDCDTFQCKYIYCQHFGVWHHDDQQSQNSTLLTDVLEGFQQSRVMW